MNVLSSGAGMGMMGTIIWIAVLLVFIFIFMLRPQKKEQARRNEMMAKMAVGDTVLTSSGFYGTLIDITDDTVIVEFGNNKTAVFQCSALQSHRLKRLMTQ